MEIQLQSGYLACNGDTKNVAEYKALAEFLGTDTKLETTLETTFKLPDLQGEFLRGAGTNSHSNQGNGGTIRTHQDGTEHLRLGTYKGFDNTYSFQINTSAVSNNADGIWPENRDSDIKQRTGYTRINVSWTDVSNSTAYYTSRPTNTSVLYCIKY